MELRNSSCKLKIPGMIPKTEHTAWSAFKLNSSLMIHCVDEDPYENYGLITAGVLLDIDRNFVFLLEYYSRWKMMKIPP